MNDEMLDLLISNIVIPSSLSIMSFASIYSAKPGIKEMKHSQPVRRKARQLVFNKEVGILLPLSFCDSLDRLSRSRAESGSTHKFRVG